MRLAELLWLSAIGIALLGWLDPPVIVRPRPPLVVTLAVARGPLDAAPETNDARRTRREAADAVAATIEDGLGTAGEVRLTAFEGSRLPCGTLEPCVVVSDATIRVVAPADRTGPVSVVQIGETLSPNVGIVRADVPRVHSASGGLVRVTLEGHGVAGSTTRVLVRDGAVVVGESSRAWTDDGLAELTVPWWPVNAGIRDIHLAAVTDGVTERTTLDNEWRGPAEVGNERWPVLVYERRSSWAVTFARRVLEADGRFDVDARTDLAPAVTTATPGARLDPARLDPTRVIVVGAPEALTAADVDLLERFVHDRGGSLVLVPDRRPEGPVTRLLFHRWREHLDSAPRTAGELKAAEWLLTDDAGGDDDVWVTAERAAAVVSSPAGAGQIVVVGAMDAWRHREPGGAFDTFWRRLVAHQAEVSGAALELSLEGGEPPRLTMRGRSVMNRMAWRATAGARCGDGPTQPIRMWPAAGSGTFVAPLRPGLAARGCVLTGMIDGVGEGRTVAGVTRAASSEGRAYGETLEDVVRRTGGSWVRAAELDRLVTDLHALRGEAGTPEPRYPMRSVWWLVPLLSCLAGDWWLRRRAGRR
jgi:hypothetical protein